MTTTAPRVNLVHTIGVRPNHTDTVTVIDDFTLTGCASWGDLPGWDVDGPFRGRTAWLGMLWHDESGGQWWAQEPNQPRATAARFATRDAALVALASWAE